MNLQPYIKKKILEGPILAKEKTQLNGRSFKYRNVYIRLKKYVDQFLKERNENRIILLPGLRGVGKTTLLFQIYLYLYKEMGLEQDQILYFSTDELVNFAGSNIYELIKEYVEKIHNTTFVNLKKRLFILIDEAHFDKKWDLALKVIYDQTKNIFILVTGSSALNIEMGVDLARRTAKETIFPLNFSEYLLLKYDIFAPKGTSQILKDLIFHPSKHTINESMKVWREIKKKTLGLNFAIEKEFEEFILHGGFPFGINLDAKEFYKRVFDMIERVIEKDIFTIKRFETKMRDSITRVLAFLALQKPGSTSDKKLAERLNRSPTSIREILNVLELTHLIFSVKPYGGIGKKIRKSWKYYFLSPSITTAVRYKLGVDDLRDRDNLGLIAEGYVGSILFKIKEIGNEININYDPTEGGVDFLITTPNNKIIPIEVKYGKSEDYQIKKAVKRYNSEYGIIISNSDKLELKNNILYLPLALFGFV